MKWSIISTIIAFILASIFHFVFEWTNKNIIAGLFFPISESIWEHLKLSFYPLLLVWITSQLSQKTKSYFDSKSVIPAIALSFVISSTIIVNGYYTLKFAFCLEALWIDLILLFIGLFAGQYFSSKVISYYQISKTMTYISLIFVIIIALCFAFFNFFPPNLPLFTNLPV